MREVFKSWRRKAGCAALVMALVLAGGWIRSIAYFDVIWITINDERYFACSVGERVAFSSEHSDLASGWMSAQIDIDRARLLSSRFQWLYYSSPYWLLTIPLTIFSAYLILGKPRKRKAESNA